MSDGVLIALFGLTATVTVAVVSQWMQSRRETKRLSVETEERKSDRIYEHRRAAYVDFAAAFGNLSSDLLDHKGYEGASREKPSDQELADLIDHLNVLRLFSTFEAFVHAKDATQSLAYWFAGGTHDGRKTPDADDVSNIYALFLDQARVDLGADEWPDSAFE